MISGVAGAVIMGTAPAVTAAASILFLGDKTSWRKLAAITLAVIGVVILHWDQGSSQGGEQGAPTIAGAGLVFGAVCCEAAYTLLGKKASAAIDPIMVAFLAAALSLPIFLPLAIWQWRDVDLTGVAWQGWTAVIWYGAGTLALGSWLWYSGVSKVEGAVAAGFMGVMPASALILSYALLGEPFRWMHIAGFAAVFLGVLLISWEHARMHGEGR